MEPSLGELRMIQKPLTYGKRVFGRTLVRVTGLDTFSGEGGGVAGTLGLQN